MWKYRDSESKKYTKTPADELYEEGKGHILGLMLNGVCSVRELLKAVGGLDWNCSQLWATIIEAAVANNRKVIDSLSIVRPACFCSCPESVLRHVTISLTKLPVYASTQEQEQSNFLSPLRGVAYHFTTILALQSRGSVSTCVCIWKIMAELELKWFFE